MSVHVEGRGGCLVCSLGLCSSFAVCWRRPLLPSIALFVHCCCCHFHATKLRSFVPRSITLSIAIAVVCRRPGARSKQCVWGEYGFVLCALCVLLFRWLARLCVFATAYGRLASHALVGLFLADTRYFDHATIAIRSSVHRDGRRLSITSVV